MSENIFNLLSLFGFPDKIKKDQKANSPTREPPSLLGLSWFTPTNESEKMLQSSLVLGPTRKAATVPNNNNHNAEEAEKIRRQEAEERRRQEAEQVRKEELIKGFTPEEKERYDRYLNEQARKEKFQAGQAQAEQARRREKPQRQQTATKNGQNQLTPHQVSLNRMSLSLEVNRLTKPREETVYDPREVARKASQDHVNREMRKSSSQRTKEKNEREEQERQMRADNRRVFSNKSVLGPGGDTYLTCGRGNKNLVLNDGSGSAFFVRLGINAKHEAQDFFSTVRSEFRGGQESASLRLRTLGDRLMKRASPSTMSRKSVDGWSSFFGNSGRGGR